jgi:hypothetical protein
VHRTTLSLVALMVLMSGLVATQRDLPQWIGPFALVDLPASPGLEQGDVITWKVELTRPPLQLPVDRLIEEENSVTLTLTSSLSTEDDWVEFEITDCEGDVVFDAPDLSLGSQHFMFVPSIFLGCSHDMACERQLCLAVEVAKGTGVEAVAQLHTSMSSLDVDWDEDFWDLPDDREVDVQVTVLDEET